MHFEITDSDKIELEKRAGWIEKYFTEIEDSLNKIEKRRKEGKIPRRASMNVIRSKVRQGLFKINTMKRIIERLKMK